MTATLDLIRRAASHDFQEDVRRWVADTFGEHVANDRVERGLRVLEEVMELAQVVGVDEEHARGLVDRVYSRPAGELRQELGGSVVTLAALAAAVGESAAACGWRELDRVEGRQDEVRASHARKVAAGLARQ